MADIFTPQKRSWVMSRIRSRTRFEAEFLSALSPIIYPQGFRYRKNHPRLPGKPDIAFLQKRLAVFLDSCFWHGCKIHGHIPKSRRSYWSAKIERNRRRDAAINRTYKKAGWKILRFWEHNIAKNPSRALQAITNALA